MDYYCQRQCFHYCASILSSISMLWDLYFSKDLLIIHHSLQCGLSLIGDTFHDLNNLLHLFSILTLNLALHEYNHLNHLHFNILEFIQNFFFSFTIHNLLHQSLPNYDSTILSWNSSFFLILNYPIFLQDLKKSYYYLLQYFQMNMSFPLLKNFASVVWYPSFLLLHQYLHFKATYSDYYLLFALFNLLL